MACQGTVANSRVETRLGGQVVMSLTADIHGKFHQVMFD